MHTQAVKVPENSRIYPQIVWVPFYPKARHLIKPKLKQSLPTVVLRQPVRRSLETAVRVFLRVNVLNIKQLPDAFVLHLHVYVLLVLSKIKKAETSFPTDFTTHK